MIKGMSHVGISVSSLARSIEFYRDQFGMEVVVETSFEGDRYDRILALRGAAGRVALLRAANMELELFEFASPIPHKRDERRTVCDHGISHFCLEVSDIDQMYQRLMVAGVVFHCEPIDFSGKAKATYGRDPDGNVFELLELTRGAQSGS